ncbi:MAG TPA: EAL domain-containing protein [Chloroflexota bacterium]|nr:EAL domain-containing protein [Chloroflexota bacterium]
MDGSHLSAGQAARHPGIAWATLLRAMRRGAIAPATRTPGACFRFRVAALDRYAHLLAARAARSEGAPTLRRIASRPPDPGVHQGRFEALVHALTQIVWITASDGCVSADLPLWRAYTGQTVAQVQGWGWLDAVHPDDREAAVQLWMQAVAGETNFEAEYRLRRADGVYRPFLMRAAPVRDAEGCIVEWVGVCLDQTARYHSAADAQALIETAFDAIITINHVGRVVAFNPAAESMFGYSRGSVLGKELADLIIPPEHRAAHRAGLARYLATGESTMLGRRLAMTAQRADGSVFPAEIALARLPLDGPPLFTGYLRDVTERVQLEEELRHQALHDALTGLPNRTLLHDRLQQALASAARERHPLALLLLDLNHFKEVNDTFGHAAGDRLLQQVAARLQGVLRAADTVARLGGDEFAVLLPGTEAAGATLATEKLLEVLDAPVVIEGQAFPVAASVGLALSPEHGTDAPTLLRHADVAMYAAKAARCSYAVYASAQDPYSPSRLDLIAALRQSIMQGDLLLHYQPKVEMASRRICGAEALVRWQHPQQGLIPPTRFIPLAEQTGLIAPLTQWVLGAVMRQWRTWRRCGLSLDLAVNLSMWDVHDPHLPESIARLLRSSRVPPHALRVELTESTIMTDADRALNVLTRLHSQGVRISVDDFGTGYSSLSYLQRLPVDELKIDKSFVQQMATANRDAAIVTSTIGLGRGLGLRVVAEGVEDQATWDRLAELGCDIVQGYFVSRPLPPAEFARWLRTAPWITGS